jgi:hypothetical protein
MRVKNYGPANCNKILCTHKLKYHSQTNKTQTPAQTQRGTFHVHTYAPHATHTVYLDFLITEQYFLWAGIAQSVHRRAMGWTIMGSNLGWGGGGRDFHFVSRPALGPTQPPVQWVPIPFLEIKRSGRSVDDPSPSITVLNERIVNLIFC